MGGRYGGGNQAFRSFLEREGRDQGGAFPASVVAPMLEGPLQHLDVIDFLALRAREKDALPPADRERLAELLREFETVTGDAFDAAPAPPSR